MNLRRCAMGAEAQIIQGHLAQAIPFKRKTPVQDGVVLLSGDSLTPKPVAWLWRDWLALGKVHLLAGAPGQGKTTIAIAFAATITSGGRWPDGTRCETGNVLVWSGEDDPADTLLPRLMAAGGNRSKVHFVDSTRIAGENLAFDPARDMKALQAAAEKIGDIRLIVVDPIVSAVTGDSHKNTETRRALQPLVDLAANMNAVLLGITHFSKGGQGGDPSQRVLGSVAFTAVARVVLVAAKVQGEDGNNDRRILARSKSNIGPDDGGFEYHLEQGEPLPGIEASYVTWGAAVAGSARELLSDPNEQDGEEKGAQASATEFLKEMLKDCPVCSKDLEAQAKEAGISWRTIRRVSDTLGIIKRPAADKRWYWKLPNLSKNGQLVQLVQSPGVDNLDNMADLSDREVSP
jgi:putative DNA primase/helicase